jgi:glycosyltransferase involved in cell wall biosynthesis
MRRRRDVRRPLVVIPALNEEGALPGVLEELTRALPDMDVLVVDDGSTDDTSAVARAGGATVLTLPFNLGVGGALRAGFRYACDRGYERVVQLDADGQHDPVAVRRLLQGLDHGADMVIGNRFGIGTPPYRVGAARGIAMALLRVLVRLVAGARVRDTTSGFRAFGPRALALFSRQLSVEYMGDTVEALLLAVQAGLNVEEVPAAMRERVAGEPSNRSLLLVYRYLSALLVIFVNAGRPSKIDTEP